MEALINHLLDVAVGALAVWAYNQYKATQALKAGLQAILRDRIIQGYNFYVVEQGWMPIYAKDSILAVYKAYEALGDNGVINDLMAQIRELPNYPNEEKGEHNKWEDSKDRASGSQKTRKGYSYGE